MEGEYGCSPTAFIVFAMFDVLFVVLCSALLDEEEDTCEKLSFGVFHFFHFFVHARISAGLCPFSLIFSTNDSVFRAEHAPLLRRAYFLSKTRDLRVRKKVKKVKNTKR